MSDGRDQWYCRVCGATGYESLSSLAGHQKVCPGLIAPSDGGVAEFGRLAEKSHRMYAGRQVGPQGEPWRPRVGDVCRTRDGGRARVVCDDRADSSMPVVALYHGPSGGEEGVGFYDAAGRCMNWVTAPTTVGEHPLDLLPPPRKGVVWVLAEFLSEADGGIGWHTFRERPDVPTGAGRCLVKVQLEEGRFDE